MDRSTQFTIHDAATSSGLTPSVIRVWEERYGWPSPKRQPNGYRAFALHEVEDLKRVAELVRSGMPISKLIVDGLPSWPESRSRPAPRHDVAIARGLPTPPSGAGKSLRDAVCLALEDLHHGRALEAIQRASLELRPAEELLAVLAPALVAVAELHQQQRHLPHANEVVSTIRERCVQLARRFPVSGQPVLVAARDDGADAHADLVVALLAARGVAARRVADASATASILVSTQPPTGDRRELRPCVTLLPFECCIPVAQLLDPGRPRETLLTAAPKG